MAGDIVRDLEFDEPPEHLDITQLRADENRMSCIRAYLACYYLCSVFASTFQKKHNVPYVQWTETCCNILDRDCNNEEAEADRALVWLVRLGHIMEENTSLGSRQKGIQHSPQHLQLMYKGLEAQFREWKSQIPADAATKRENFFFDPNNTMDTDKLCSGPPNGELVHGDAALRSATPKNSQQDKQNSADRRIPHRRRKTPPMRQRAPFVVGIRIVVTPL